MAKKAKPNGLLEGHKANFETLKKAFANGDAALMDCTLKATGEKVAVICAVHRNGGEYVFSPLAMLFNDNPYDLLIPPMTEEKEKEG